MKLWLSRKKNGDYFLTKLFPEDAKVDGCSVKDLYPKKGDPLGFAVGQDGIEQLFEETQEFTHLDPLQTVKVNLTLVEDTRILKLKPLWKFLLGL